MLMYIFWYTSENFFLLLHREEGYDNDIARQLQAFQTLVVSSALIEAIDSS